MINFNVVFITTMFVFFLAVVKPESDKVRKNDRAHGQGRE